MEERVFGSGPQLCLRAWTVLVGAHGVCVYTLCMCVCAHGVYMLIGFCVYACMRML